MPNILCKKIFSPKICWGSTLNPSWSNSKWVCLWITVHCMQQSRKSVLPHWIRLYLPPLSVYCSLFGPLLTVLPLHQRGASDSWNQYVNDTLKNTHGLALYMHPTLMDGCKPLISVHCGFASGHCSNGVVGLVYWIHKALNAVQPELNAFLCSIRLQDLQLCILAPTKDTRVNATWYGAQSHVHS